MSQFCSAYVTLRMTPWKHLIHPLQHVGRRNLIILKTKKNDTKLKPSYQQALSNENINSQIVKSKFTFKYLNYNFKKNILN